MAKALRGTTERNGLPDFACLLAFAMLFSIGAAEAQTADRIVVEAPPPAKPLARPGAIPLGLWPSTPGAFSPGQAVHPIAPGAVSLTPRRDPPQAPSPPTQGAQQLTQPKPLVANPTAAQRTPVAADQTVRFFPAHPTLQDRLRRSRSPSTGQAIVAPAAPLPQSGQPNGLATGLPTGGRPTQLSVQPPTHRARPTKPPPGKTTF